MKSQLKWNLALSALQLSIIASGCTGQIPGSFRYIQQVQSFSSQQDVNTKLDLLWVVDNSSSMDVSQSKLRAGFQSFANKYMQPTWDIRVAVITTDTYLANPAFSTYLSTVVPGSVGYISTYISSRLGTFQNPSWNPNLINPSTGAMDTGVKYGELIPLWGPNYARLLPGYHDGPITALCFEGMPYFIKGVTQCKVRDDQALYSGSSHCLSPDTGAGETSLSQCVNTIQNDTVRSARPIIATMPPTGTVGDAAWTNQLLRDFMVNVSAGSAGNGSERGLSSVLQLLADNESTSTSFFRKGSLRGLIFLTDEDDQSMVIPDQPDSTFSPMSKANYKCDQASLVAANGASAITGVNGLCSSNSSNNSRYGSLGTSCPSVTVDGYTYPLGICADSSQLIPVATMKQSFDTFFTNLDENTGGDANYFVAVITPTTAAGIQALQTARAASDAVVGTVKVVEVSRGDRYLELATLVGTGDLALDLSASDYSPVLDAIGQKIVTKKSTFTLSRAPSGKEEMLVSIVHADGSETVVPSSYYVISGKDLVFLDQSFVLSLSATDHVVINYQPKTVLE